MGCHTLAGGPAGLLLPPAGGSSVGRRAARLSRPCWTLPLLLCLVASLAPAVAALPPPDAQKAGSTVDWRATMQALEDYYRGKIKPPPMPAGKATAQGVTYDWADPAWGSYRQRGVSRGISIWAWDIVSEQAVKQAARILQGMLAATPLRIQKRLRSSGAKVAIIGKTQFVWDIPEHHFLINQAEFWRPLRGAGGTQAIPTASGAEENLLELPEDTYYSENVLVHEFAHSINLVGMSDCERAANLAAYKAAVASGQYDTSPSAYLTTNELEFFAMLTQGWFEATARADATIDGLTSRYRVLARDAGAVGVLYNAFGARPWRYPVVCPVCRTKWPSVPAITRGFVKQQSKRGCARLVTPVIVNKVLSTTSCPDKDPPGSCQARARGGQCTKRKAALVGVFGRGTYRLGNCLNTCKKCRLPELIKG